MRITSILLSFALALVPAAPALAQINETTQVPAKPVTSRGEDVVRLYGRAKYGNIPDQVRLADAYDDGDGVAKDRALALVWFKAAANYGDAEAQYEMGRAYLLGQGVPRDTAQAADWLRKSAEQGYGPAQVMFGFLYEDGEGVPRDDVQAYTWRTLSLLVPRAVIDKDGRIAAGNDLLGAKLTAAQMAQAEAQIKAWKPAPLTPDQQVSAAIDSVKVNPIHETLNVLRPLAEGGHVRAQYLLGALYGVGMGMPRDPATAIVWYQKAAEQGHPVAQYMLGLAYQKGEDLAKDDAAAIRWLRPAADANIGKAQYLLGILHLGGKGVPPDDVAGRALLQAAADQGESDAQYFLSTLIVAGRGGPADLVEGYKWLLLTEAYRDDDEILGMMAELKADLITKMTPAEIAEAERRAAVWMPTFPKP
ncbi:hypothetical protein ABAC402_07370 [Asticcacaulis sp. AC402]|nr:hypothetical protein ABAC402_07370 [Asticcacaulis sp. AC402]